MKKYKIDEFVKLPEWFLMDKNVISVCGKFRLKGEIVLLHGRGQYTIHGCLYGTNYRGEKLNITNETFLVDIGNMKKNYETENIQFIIID